MSDREVVTMLAGTSIPGFDPLPRIVMFDHFDSGLTGWLEVIGNFEADVAAVTRYPELMDSRPPMLSTATMPDTGSQGALTGNYAMKVATRPRAGHIAKALKRMTFAREGRLRCEAQITFKPEPRDLVLGDTDVGAFGISYDLQDGDRRYWPAIRFLNAADGERIERWQYHESGERMPHLDGWVDVPGDAHQELCYNETDTKQNWHYVSWEIDLASRQYVELRCNNRRWDLRGLFHKPLEAEPNLNTLMNLGFFVETDTDKRAFLYVDSVVLSMA